MPVIEVKATNSSLPEPLLSDGAASTRLASSIPPADAQESFNASALQALTRVRASLEQVIRPISRGLKNSRDLQNLLLVDRTLSWQIFKMLGPIDTLSTLPYMPAAASINKLLLAAKKQGVPAARLDEAAAAFASFEAFVLATAGDRERFETMVLSFTNTTESHQVGLQHRKSAFKAHSHFFGIEVDAVINSILFHPSAVDNTFDIVALMQLVGMRRLRLDTDVRIHGARCGNKSDEPVRPYGTLNDKAADVYGAPLIPEFCTRPVPPLETVVVPSGMQYTLLRSQEIGVGKEIDLAMGRVWKSIPLSRHDEEGEYFGALVEMTRPTKLLVVDILVPKAYPNLIRHAATYAHAPKEKPMNQVEREGVRMPMREQLIPLGNGLDNCRVREVPTYLELLQHTGEKMDWLVEEFDVYRIRVEYPLMDTMLVLRLSIS